MLIVLLILLATALVMLPMYGIVVFVIDDQNAEYLKASAGYGPNVPSTVEGGSPDFIILSLVPLALVFAGGIAAAIVFARRRQATWLATLIPVGIGGAVIVLSYLVWNLTAGPTWPPQLG